MKTDSAPDETLASTVNVENETAEQSEERRRRRRRGGRNRNRRDREGNDAFVPNDELDSRPTPLIDTQAAPQPVDAPTAIPTALPTEAAPVASVAAPSISVITPLAQFETPAPVPTQVSAAPQIQHAESVSSIAVAETPPEAIQHEASASMPPVREVPVAQMAPVVLAVESTTLKIAPAPMPLDSLREVLSSAGLTLASTDPDKLRAAQEAAAKIIVAPRVPRERKVLPPVSNEPLIQVETRQ